MARYEFSNSQNAEFAGILNGAQSFFNLGMMYATGRSVEPDLVAAHKWFNLAAMQGDKSARDYRIEIAQEMSHDEIVEAQKLARQFLQTH